MIFASAVSTAIGTALVLGCSMAIGFIWGRFSKSPNQDYNDGWHDGYAACSDNSMNFLTPLLLDIRKRMEQEDGKV